MQGGEGTHRRTWRKGGPAWPQSRRNGAAERVAWGAWCGAQGTSSVIKLCLLGFPGHSRLEPLILVVNARLAVGAQRGAEGQGWS